MEHVEVLRDLSEVCRAAIKAGDWKVDGACDPDSLLRHADAAIASLSAPQPPAEAEIERLRAEVGIAEGQAEFYRTERNKCQRHAKRLAEALRGLVEVFSESGMYDEEVFAKARAALDQEVGNG